MSAEPTFRRPRPAGLLRLFFKIPPLVYHGPLAEFLRSRCVLLITTRGRHSGLPRTTALSFMPIDDHFVVFAGWGIRANWYRNARAHPEVRLKVGRRELRATARLVEDPARRVDLMRQMQARSSGCGPPRAIRPLLRLTRMFDYQAEIDGAVSAGPVLPVVELIPAV